MKKFVKLAIIAVLALLTITACKEQRNPWEDWFEEEFAPIPYDEATEMVANYIDDISKADLQSTAGGLLTSYGTNLYNGIKDLPQYDHLIDSAKSIMNHASCLYSTNPTSDDIEALKPAFKRIGEFVEGYPVLSWAVNGIIEWLDSSPANPFISTGNIGQLLAMLNDYLSNLASSAPSSGDSFTTSEILTMLVEDILKETSKLASVTLSDILSTPVNGVSASGNYTMVVSDYSISEDDIYSMLQAELYPVLDEFITNNTTASAIFPDCDFTAPIFTAPVSISIEVTSEDFDSEIFKSAAEYRGTVIMTLNADVVRKTYEYGNETDEDFNIELKSLDVSSDGALRVRETSRDRAYPLSFDIPVDLNGYADIDSVFTEGETSQFLLEVEHDKPIFATPEHTDLDVPSDLTFDILAQLVNLDPEKGVVRYHNTRVDFADVYEKTEQGK